MNHSDAWPTVSVRPARLMKHNQRRGGNGTGLQLKAIFTPRLHSFTPPVRESPGDRAVPWLLPLPLNEIGGRVFSSSVGGKPCISVRKVNFSKMKKNEPIFRRTCRRFQSDTMNCAAFKVTLHIKRLLYIWLGDITVIGVKRKDHSCEKERGEMEGKAEQKIQNWQPGKESSYSK